MGKQRKIYQSVLGVALVTVLILLVPFVAMQFTDQVVWGAADFIIIGILVFGTGLSYVLVTRSAANTAYRAATGLALGTALFMIWANLAVGLISSGPNPGNLMYIGVLVVGLVGAIHAHFSAGGMERAMYATALALVLHTAIALITHMHHYPGSSVIKIVGVNGFFAALFIVSGLFFRHAADQQSPSNSGSA